MPKLASSILTFLGYLFATPLVAYAATPLVKDPAKLSAKVENVPQLIIQWIFIIAIFLAVVYLMFGGIKLITSRGDKIAVESARRHITFAILGLVIVIGTFFILNVLFNVLGIENPINKGFVLPTLKNVNQ